MTARSTNTFSLGAMMLKDCMLAEFAIALNLPFVRDTAPFCTAYLGLLWTTRGSYTANLETSEDDILFKATHSFSTLLSS
jgi:hypothetical protein